MKPIEVQEICALLSVFDMRTRVTALPGPFASLLSASDPFVLQDSDHDATVLSLAFSCAIRTYLPAFTHSAWSEDIGKGDVSLQQQELAYVIGPVFAQRLIERSAPYR